MAYKRMAGTSAVFVNENDQHSSAQERDGMSWSADELHLETIPETLTRKEPMANSLSLEGLEEYDPPNHGDTREMQCLDSDFVYIEAIKGWVQVKSPYKK